MAEMKPVKTIHRTVFLLILLLGLGFGLAVANLVRWQLVRGEELRTAAIDQSLTSTFLNAERGTIYDTTGKVVAESASVWSVVLEPNYIEDDERETIITGLAEILDMKEEDVRAEAEADSYFTYLKRKMESSVKDEVLAFLEEKEISGGVRMVEEYKRYYPYGSTCSSVLGFVGTDNNGLYGLELYYDDELSGTQGHLVRATNAVGTDMPFQYEQLVEAQDGYDLYMTIDMTVQSIVEKHLKKGVEDNLVQNGAAAIVMDVETGGIVAMASVGDFDPNQPFEIADENLRKQIEALPEDKEEEAWNEALLQQWRNKAINDTYYPGSVFKMVTGSAGLEEGIITPDTTFTCTGAVQVEDTWINCWDTTGHGTQTFREGLCNSCNPFFIEIGSQLGPDMFYEYFKSFGFTEHTGIDLPGEANNLYYTAEQLKPVELATESFGQNFSITPLQMVTAASTIANGGNLVQPHVVEKVVDASGNIVSTADTSYKRQVISEETARTMIDILQENATTGTAKNGYVAGYRVCGKTGTSEKVAKWLEDKTKPMTYIASYCGFAPADDPKYALIVMLDEPNGASYYGGAVAGPVFQAMMSEILPYLGVTAEYTEEEAAKLNTTAPSVENLTVEEARDAIENAGLTCKVIGGEEEGTTVIRQIPAAGAEVPRDGMVVLYTSSESLEETVEVPDFTNYSLQDVLAIASARDLQITVEGAGLQSSNVTAYSQDITAGSKVAPGTVITVNFIEKDQVN